MITGDESTLSRRNFLKALPAAAGGAASLSREYPVLSEEKTNSAKGRFTIVIEDRPYDHHRPKGCTVLIIKNTDWPGNEFGLWLPETIYINDEIRWCNWSGEDIHQDWSKESNGNLLWKYSTDIFEITSILIPDEHNSCLWYRHTFKNNSNAVLRKLNTQTCFHLVNAPQFISYKGERIWANLDGSWTTTDNVPRHESPDPRRVVFLKNGVRSERTVVPITTFPSAIMPESAHHSLFIAENFQSTASVGIASRNFYKLFNNNDSILRCIHSEPFPITNLKPGESTNQDAVIIFHNGNYLSLLKHYEKKINNNWPD